MKTTLFLKFELEHLVQRVVKSVKFFNMKVHTIRGINFLGGVLIGEEHVFYIVGPN